MLAEDFVAQKQETWARLEALIKRARRSFVGLSAEELLELGRLYRQATSDLAVSQRDYPHHPVRAYLTNLVGQAHGHVYRTRSTRMRHIRAFFTTTFPRVFRATWPHSLASFLMFIIPAIVSYLVAYTNPDAITHLFPGFENILADIRTNNEWWQSINQEGRAASSSMIMTNNIRVVFLAFAGGVLFGTLSLYILAMNGMLLGSVAGAAHRFQFADNLWGFVAAHGVVELSVIFIAGGAGLQLGWSLLRPGLLTRRAALTVAAHRAFQLVAGCVPLLVLAGIIEGFVSPSTLPLIVKYAVALSSGIALFSYLILAGRETAAVSRRARARRRPRQSGQAAGPS